MKKMLYIAVIACLCSQAEAGKVKTIEESCALRRIDSRANVQTIQPKLQKYLALCRAIEAKRKK
jgi:hypothetical protein